MTFVILRTDDITAFRRVGVVQAKTADVAILRGRAAGIVTRRGYFLAIAEGKAVDYQPYQVGGEEDE